MGETDTSEVERIKERALNLAHPPGIARADIRTLLDEIERLRPYEPDHAAVRAAQALAADTIDSYATDAPTNARGHANDCAADLRDLARTVREPRDDGGNVDHLTLLDIALDVDGFTSLAELRDKVSDLRKVVAGG